MAATWKAVLYEYVRNRNQMELDYSIRSLLPFVSDEKYVEHQNKRLKMLNRWHKERGCKPVKSETRVRLNRVDESEHKVIVEMDLKRTYQYPAQPEEERLEKERLILHRRAGSWTISSIELISNERGIIPLNPVHQTDQKSTALPTIHCAALKQSFPYLNYGILHKNYLPERSVRYDRAKVRQYADLWWNSYNPQFLQFDVDCTNFVSQCLFAGGAPMNYTGRRESGWWYQGKKQHQELWSFSWAVAQSLQRYLNGSKTALLAEVVDSPGRLQIGDVIAYDWDGDSKFQHTVIVTAKDANGMPLINAHTINSKHRYWDYRDSYAWSENTRYRFFHIPDTL